MHMLRRVSHRTLLPFSEENIVQESGQAQCESSQFSFKCNTYLYLKMEYYSKSKCCIKIWRLNLSHEPL